MQFSTGVLDKYVPHHIYLALICCLSLSSTRVDGVARGICQTDVIIKCPPWSVPSAQGRKARPLRLSNYASVTLPAMICCFYTGEDGVAHGICQTDASVTLPHMIRCFCAGEDGVAHGTCQTDASVTLLTWSVVFVQERTELPTASIRQMSVRQMPLSRLPRSVVSVQERTELPTASVRQMSLSHCLPWSVASVQERMKSPMASVRQMRASSLPTIICCFCAGEDGVAHGTCLTDTSVTLPHIICCFYTGDDGVAHGICQTDASVTLASIICCFCSGEDKVAHGFCQTDVIIIAHHDLFYLHKGGKHGNCVCQTDASVTLPHISVERMKALSTASVNTCIRHIASHDLFL